MLVRDVPVRLIEFAPSTTAASASFAVNVPLVTVITPVEYRPAERYPFEVKVPSLTVTVPPPRSVATTELLLPEVVAVTLVRLSVPSWAASAPCALAPVALIVVPFSVTVAPSPDAKTPFPYCPLVVIVPPVMETEPPVSELALDP